MTLCSGFAEHLHLAYELVSRHGDIIGRKRPNVKLPLKIAPPVVRLACHRDA